METSVELALPIGYRMFDTASLYKTEEHLGVTLKANLLKNPNIKRKDLFIVTKV